MPRVPEEVEQDVGLQMAPMINVMLVLLASFVATAGVVQKEFELGVKVPGQSENQPKNKNTEDTPINIEIDPNGTVFFNRKSIDSPTDKEMPTLKARLKRATDLFGEQPVIVRPHADTPHARVIDVLNACSASGVKNLSFGEKR
ncbi:MAG: biopolymer transporter ExbD [Verrucomicrobiota bacterium]